VLFNHNVDDRPKNIPQEHVADNETMELRVISELGVNLVNQTGQGKFRKNKYRVSDLIHFSVRLRELQMLNLLRHTRSPFCWIILTSSSEIGSINEFFQQVRGVTKVKLFLPPKN
jgi:hypothetical protein